jgi:hypothetical protein
MRKSRDIDAELMPLQDKQRSLKLKRITQFGELITATGNDALDLETLAGVLLDAVERAKTDPSTKGHGSGGARASFAANGGPSRTVPVTLLRELQAAAAALFRTTTAFSRAERPHARFDTRAWMQARRARTSRLIELGGLVQKSGLADQLANEHFPPAEVLARWRAVGRAALSPPHQPNMKPR